ncbi:hypothetical protein [Psychrobacillus sp. FSL K6-1464]|uniref:hypothetical protein n=1 Tax=Psychrobacillus sp. FSL K6-1464 TaxID=2921545 RepID=UPI0030F4DD16
MKKIGLMLLSASLILSLNVGDVSAATITKAEQSLVSAEKSAKALRWQVSYELNKELAKPNMKVFNDTKKFNATAKAEINKVKDKALKSKLENRRKNVDVIQNQALTFIDAHTASVKVNNLQLSLAAEQQKGLATSGTQKAHKALEKELKKLEIIVNRTYGQSTRKAFFSKHRDPAKKVLAISTKEVVTKDSIDELQIRIAKKMNDTDVDEMSKQVLDRLALVGNDTAYQTLHVNYLIVVAESNTYKRVNAEVLESIQNEYSGNEILLLASYNDVAYVLIAEKPHVLVKKNGVWVIESTFSANTTANA